jgi:hypothetical protein
MSHAMLGSRMILQCSQLLGGPGKSEPIRVAKHLGVPLAWQTNALFGRYGASCSGTRATHVSCDEASYYHLLQGSFSPQTVYVECAAHDVLAYPKAVLEASRAIQSGRPQAMLGSVMLPGGGRVMGPALGR